MKELQYHEIPKEALEQLSKGAFLTVKDKNDTLNTMTIGWWFIGYMWMKPCFITVVRKSRHTFQMIEEVKDFTVSIPVNGQLKKELGICGTKSGRDIDKFETCNLTADYLKNFRTPVIKECDLHFLCKIEFKQPMDENYMTQMVKDVYGPSKDFHTMYYGVISSILLTENNK